jgi:DNA polymerase
MAKVFPGALITKIHGQPKRIGNTMYLPLFHPAAVLRRPDLMGAMTADMKKIPVLLDEMRKAPAGESAISPTAQEEAPVQLGLFDM